MAVEGIEYHPPVIKEQSRLQRIGRTLITGGLSLIFEPKPRFDFAHATEDTRSSLEEVGYDPSEVQSKIDWVQSRGVEGEYAAALLRGAINDLVSRVNDGQERIPE